MATYLCSDLHGEYELFCGLLDRIRFSAADKLYIGGDVIDKGKASLRLVDLIMRAGNIYAIQGNHEHYFIDYVNYCCHNAGDDDEMLLKSIGEYFPESDFAIDFEMVEYISCLPFYIEKEDFILVHAGLELDESGAPLPLPRVRKETLLFDRKFKEDSVVVRSGKTVCFGHTPTSYRNNTGYFIKTPFVGKSPTSRDIRDYAKIQLDTGVSLTGMLGFLRIDDMKEFYIKRQ